MAFVLALARALGLFALARRLTRRRLRILCYHGIWMGPEPHFGDRLFMSSERFTQRMRTLAARGYEAVSLGEGWRRCQAGELTGREFVITIDDGWAGTAVCMRALLKELNWPSTLYVATRDFLVGAPVPPVMSDWLLARAKHPLDPQVVLDQAEAPADWSLAIEARVRALPDRVAQEAEWRRLGAVLGVDVGAALAARSLHLMTPEELRQCLADGMDVQLHTHAHDLGDMSPQRIAHEIQTNRQALSALLDTAPERFTQFCYPSGVHDPKAFGPLRDLGVQTTTTTVYGLAAANTDPMALPRLLDGESMSELAFEARFSGFWDGVNRLLGRPG